MNRENKALVLALLRSQQTFMRAMGSVFRLGELTASQWDVLETLSNKGALSVNELLRLTLSTSGNLDVVVKNLIQMGFVEKIVNDSDRRSRVLCLTFSGKRKVNDFYPQHNQMLADLFDGLSVKEKRSTIKSLNRLRKILAQSQEN